MGKWEARLLLIVLFFTSFSSLIYEVVWSRELSFIFGTSAYAISTVLTVFMAGLALGSLCGGRVIDQIKEKYKFLAIIEILIGLTCLATLQLLPILKNPYLYIYNTLQGSTFLLAIALFFLCIAVLIIPTFLIGVAFPTVVKLYFNEQRNIGKSVGTTYMFDTVGGAFGALLAGFLLIPTLGLFRSSLMASILNIIFGLIFYIVFMRRNLTLQPLLNKKNTKQDKLLLVLFFFSGFAALMFEVIWSRYIALLYGSSIYSFSILLASFLTGMGIGSIVISRYVDRIKNKILVFAFVELFIGLIGMCLVIIFPVMEHWFLYLYSNIYSYNVFMIALFLICFVVLLIPTMLMGATLPLLSAVYVSNDKIGTDVGELYSANSFGSILGSFVAGFIIIPSAGLVKSSIMAGLIYITIALAFMIYARSKSIEFNLSNNQIRKTIMLATTLIVLCFIVLIAFAHPNYIYNGVYYHGVRSQNYSEFFSSYDNDTLVFIGNSPYGVVTVYRDPTGKFIRLKNNGKTDAGSGDIETQAMISHLPLALHEYPRSVLNIGMGGAFSLASALTYREVQSIDCIEIDPEVVRADKTVISDYNNHALEDNRTNVVTADGRNFLFSTPKKYDVIISEPPNIWVSGVSNLFTREFYELAKAHLNTGGILAQWYPMYEMNNSDYRIALNTIRTVFPNIYEFRVQRSDVIVLASEKRFDIPADLNLTRLLWPEVDSDFRRIYENDPQEHLAAKDRINNLFFKDPDDVNETIRNVEIINTDDLPVLEFACLRNLLRKNDSISRTAFNYFTASNKLLEHGKYKESLMASDNMLEMDPNHAESWNNKGFALVKLGQTEKGLRAINRAVNLSPDIEIGWTNKGKVLNSLGRHAEAEAAFVKAMELEKSKMALDLLNKGKHLAEQGRFNESLIALDKALVAIDQAINLSPIDKKLWNYKSTILAQLGKYDEAIKCCDEAIRLDPKYSDAWYNKGNTLKKLGKLDEAIKAYDEAIRLDPNYAAASWYNKGNALKELGNYADATKAYDEAIRLNPSDATAWSNKGAAFDDQGKYDEAIKCYNEAIRLDPSYAAAWYNKGNALKELGNYADATKAYDEAIRLNPSDAAAWSNKGAAFDDQGKYDEAIKCYNEAIRLDPNLATAWFTKGIALGELGKHDEAIKAFEEVIRLDPNLATAWFTKGIALGELGKHDEAIQAYDEAIRLDPSYADAWANKGNALYSQSKYDEAIKAYDEVIRLKPKYAMAWNNKGITFELLGKTSESNAAFAKAKELGYKG
jgi:tetratricopeptide (TPR) repeat protein/predicted membrane-bound spermidine synthase